MIEYKQYQYRDLTGDHRAEIVNVDLEPNTYYDETKANSTKETLAVTFQINSLDDEPVMHTQRFIEPLTGGVKLFQQLLDAYGDLPDENGGAFDEQKFVGMNVIISIDKNQKGYARVFAVRKDEDAPAVEEKKVKKVEGQKLTGNEEDVPEFLQ